MSYQPLHRTVDTARHVSEVRTTRRTAGHPVGFCAVLLAVTAAAAPASPSTPVPRLDAGAAARFAQLALDCLHREYPNKIAHVLAGDADVHPPRELTPAFFGCFDWHSAVHAHWLLARLAHEFPDAPFVPAATAALSASLTDANVAAEVSYLRGEGRASFERPYGLAWLLALSAEMRRSTDPQSQAWAKTLAPLEREAAARISAWLPKLYYPIRVGEHSQTAFALGLVWDWAVTARDAQMQSLLVSRGRDYYLGDRSCPLAYEPSGEDFLSPCLAEADFMRRLLAPSEYARWLSGFLPQVPSRTGRAWLAPGVVTDRSDPKLAHIDGLNLSRAWMLEGIASGLPERDRRRAALAESARIHADSALPAVTGEHYEGGHWLGTFAVYLATRAGLQAD